MTNQEIYNTVRDHLLKQMARSVDAANGICAYRGMQGRKCAAGCLIPDDKYSPRIEGDRVTGIVFFYADPIFGQAETLSLISSLQSVHDMYQPKDWQQHLETTARQYDLQP